jgi:proteasome beta subunit
VTESNHKKGTTTVGLVCKGAVVLAADKRASMGHLAMHAVPKVFKVTDFIALTTAGLVSDAHNLLKYLRAEMDLYKLDKSKDPSIDVAANLLGSILYGGRQSFFPYLVGILLAGKSDDGTFKLYSLEAAGSAIMDKYTVTGSGSELALAILDNDYKKDISAEDGVKLAIKAIKSAIKRDIFTGDGIDVVIIDSKGYRKIEENKIAALAK